MSPSVSHGRSVGRLAAELPLSGTLPANIGQLTSLTNMYAMHLPRTRQADRAHSRPQAANTPVRSFVVFILVVPKLRS